MALVTQTHYASNLEPGPLGLAADGVQVLHRACWKIFILQRAMNGDGIEWLFFSLWQLPSHGSSCLISNLTSLCGKNGRNHIKWREHLLVLFKRNKRREPRMKRVLVVHGVAWTMFNLMSIFVVRRLYICIVVLVASGPYTNSEWATAYRYVVRFLTSIASIDRKVLY